MRNLISILFLVFAFSHGHAQSSALPDPKPSFFAIIVTNIDTATKWYGDKLGFELLNRVENAERGFKQANLKRGAFLLELIELNNAIAPRDILKDNSQGRIAGFFKFGFTISEFDSWVDFLKDSGAEFNGQVVLDQISGKKIVIIKDPDGNRIQLFEE